MKERSALMTHQVQVGIETISRWAMCVVPRFGTEVDARC